VIAALDGGYTIKRYGGSKSRGIDSIRRDHITPRINSAEREALIPLLACAIHNFVSSYFM
jgi:hypothetical protein